MSEQSSVFATFSDAARQGDAVQFWRERRYDGLECLNATFRRHQYVPHTHETYAIAAVFAGCEVFNYRGERRYVGPGQIALVDPDEVHDGEPERNGFVYRVLYPSVELMRSIAEDTFGRPVSGTPCFSRAVVTDPQLSAELATLQLALTDPDIPLLERDSRLHSFFATLLSRWGGLGGARKLGNENGPLDRARAFLDLHFARDISLDELASVAGLNRSHLVRAFRQALGITPHAYLMDRRSRAARRLLAAGETPLDAALACGFCDQSHLNRVFKARMGVTPGTFRAQ